ncbi:MutT/nudix family protein [Enterococcus sp. AZ196]
MTRLLAIELTMMVMIENEMGEVLVQDRKKTDWPGWTFPGGHVEKEETAIMLPCGKSKKKQD